MERALVVRGKLTDAQHIELDEPVTDLEGRVDVVLRSVPSDAKEQDGDIFDFISALKPGQRTKDHIDGQLREERESWEDQ